MNQAMDQVIGVLGTRGVACVSMGVWTNCLSYSASKPKPVHVGQDHASQPDAYLCTSKDGGATLGYCAPVEQAENTCDGGLCGCNTLDGCWDLFPSCIEGTMTCVVNEGCTCEVDAGC